MIQYGPQPKGGLLSGLAKNPNVQAFGTARGMDANAQRGMNAAQADQEYGLKQMQADSQLRQQAASNNASRAVNERQEQQQRADIANQQSAFNIGMGYDYAGLQRQRQLAMQQTLLNGLAREF